MDSRWVLSKNKKGDFSDFRGVQFIHGAAVFIYFLKRVFWNYCKFSPVFSKFYSTRELFTSGGHRSEGGQTSVVRSLFYLFIYFLDLMHSFRLNILLSSWFSLFIVFSYYFLCFLARALVEYIYIGLCYQVTKPVIVWPPPVDCRAVWLGAVVRWMRV